MQVFKTYIKILRKQLVSILIYAVMFLSITIMITSNIKNENTKFEPSKVDITVVNEDGESSLINGFLKHLENYVNFIEIDDNDSARRDALFFRRVVYILTIPEGFTDRFMSGNDVQLSKLMVPNSVEAITVDNAIDNYFNTAKVYIKHVPKIDYEVLNAYVEQNLKEETKVSFDVAMDDEVIGSNSFNRNYFNYLGYIIISAFITGVSIIMVSFHGMDIRRKHFASPLSSRSMNAQLIFGNLVFVFVYLLVFIVAGYLLNADRKLNANTILTWMNVIAFALAALSISYLVGITVKSRKAINAISTALSLSLAFISGIFVPQEYLGASVLKVASFTPTYWYVKANTALETVTSSKWSDISDIIGYMAIQIGFAAAIISIALVVSKRKRQQAF
ncbi:MAG: transporter permease [Herbinix sp.]|jgi:ABC-2 type transport system permease protein|nr:transporter permease [Herbinix sp.]